MDSWNPDSSPVYHHPVFHIVLSTTKKSEESAFCYSSLPRLRRYGPIETRAWCFQELTLSKRMIYGEQQMSFHCRERMISEDGYYRVPGWDSKEHHDMSTYLVLSESATKETILRR